MEKNKKERKNNSTKKIKTKKNKKNVKNKEKVSKIKKIIIGLFILLLLLLIFSVVINYNLEQQEKRKLEALEKERQNLVEDISKHYNSGVITNKETNLYKLIDSEYTKYGKIEEGVYLELEQVDIKYDTKYFLTNTLGEEVYISYKDVIPSEKLEEDINNRYKKYIVFNENIITNDNTSFYDENENFVFSLNKSFEFPIIIKKGDKYGIEYLDKLYYINKNNVKSVVNSNNTTEKNAKDIPVLNYHFIYLMEDEYTCQEIICHSEKQFESHLKYIKENNYLSTTMEELEMYIDGEIQLPEKSVSLTIDDGHYAWNAIEYLEKYEVYATLFLVTLWYDTDKYQSDYLEIHSHGHNIHEVGECPGGQGGGIKCKERGSLLWDLKTSSKELNGSTVFCYPFYEYNDYSIDVLKEAGYTMAFAGSYADGNMKVKVGANKYELPRIVMYSYTTLNQFISYLQ